MKKIAKILTAGILTVSFGLGCTLVARADDDSKWDKKDWKEKSGKHHDKKWKGWGSEKWKKQTANWKKSDWEAWKKKTANWKKEDWEKWRKEYGMKDKD